MGNGDGRRTEGERIGMDRMTGTEGRTKRDMDRKKDSLGCRTQGKGGQSEPCCPTEDLFTRVDSVSGSW